MKFITCGREADNFEALGDPLPYASSIANVFHEEGVLS